MWCVPKLDEDYIAAMEDVLATYEKPYDPLEPVVCLDEKPVTLHADTRPTTLAKPGRATRRDYEYTRNGTANAFCAVQPKAPRFLTWITPRRSGFYFALTLLELAMAYPEAVTIHLILDNLNTHRRKSLVDAFGEVMANQVWARFTIHYTPKHGSWLNQAEIAISLLSRQCLGNRRIPDIATLRREVRFWTRKSNRNNVTIKWTFDRKAARKTFGYKRKRIKRSKH